jgi:TolB-like protein/DNA-binding winged helix-turn-helix (wHTH) protein/Tfp pilus assembly protein PilF
MHMSKLTRRYYEFGLFTLDPAQRLLLCAGKVVALTPKVFETLLVLVENTGRVVTKDDLLNKIWPDTIVEERCLSQNIFLLRKALGEDARGRQYIETIPKVGYRFLPGVLEGQNLSEAPSGTMVVQTRDRLRIVATEEEIIAGENAPVFETLAPRALVRSIGENAPISLPSWIVLLLLGLLMASSAAAYLGFSSTAASSIPVEAKSIAVLPFKPLGSDPNDEYLGLGMADTLIGRLSHLSQVVVRPTSAIRRYSGSDLDVIAAGREQRVDAVLEGSIYRSGERIRLSVQLVSVRDGASLWSYKCDERCSDIFAVQDSISERVAEALALKLTGEERRLLTKHETENTVAYQLYLEGRYFWNKRSEEGFKKALDYFNQTIEVDPNYALAYVGLADAYTMLADYDWLPATEAGAKAKAAVTRALEIDETLAEAHASLADIKRFYDWDFAGAEQAYKRAIELNPNYVTAHQWYGEFLSAMGRHDEAIREMKRAEELDPVSVVVKNASGWILLFARRYDEAIAACQKVIELDPGYGEVYSQLRRAYEQKGMYAEALAADEKFRMFKTKAFRRSNPLSHLTPIPSAKAYWQKMLARTEQDVRDDLEAAQFRLVEIYAQLGEPDQALKWLGRLYEDHHFWMPFLNVHAHLDPLRSDPRFNRMLKQIGLQN